jgi:hypothetical protein
VQEKEGIMRTTKWTAIAIAVATATTLGLASCGSSSTEQSTVEPASSAQPSPTPSALDTATPQAAPVASEPVPSTCPEFAMTAAHMATDWQYLSINLGTTNDEQPTLNDLSAGVKAMQSLAPECAPKAAASIDAFAATVDAILPVYTTQPTGDQVQQVDDALAAMQEAGAQMYADMELSDYAWQSINRS